MKGSRFAWLTFCTALTALVFSVIGWHRTVPPELASRPTAGAHAVLAALVPPSPSFYDNLQSTGQFWVNDPHFGGKCDGSTDDTTAFVNTETKRAAMGGEGHVPPGTCKVSSMLTLGPGAVWIGTRGQSTIQAAGAMPAIASITGVGTTLSGLNFDGNAAASNCLLRLSDRKTNLTGNRFDNCLVDGLRSAANIGPATISAVSQTGSGPAIAVSALDAYSMQIAGSSVCVKITTGGALGTATFQLSTGGCAGPFSGLNQTLFAATQIGYPSNPNFLTNTGLLLTTSGGPFVLNTTYGFTATATASANNYLLGSANNATRDGTVYTSAALASGYISYQNVVAPGTVATVTGSPLVVGTGTTWLTAMPGTIDGDQLVIDNGGTFYTFLVSAILSDTQLWTDLSSPPTFTASGLPWAIGVGAGLSEDPATGNQSGTIPILWTSEFCAIGARFSGLGGPGMLGPVLHNSATTDAVFGTGFSD